MTIYKVGRKQLGFDCYLSCGLPVVSPYCCTYNIGQTTMACDDTEGVYVFKDKENALNFIKDNLSYYGIILLKCKSVGRVTKAKYLLYVDIVIFGNQISVKDMSVFNKYTNRKQSFAQILQTKIPHGSFACKGVYVESVEEI